MFDDGRRTHNTIKMKVSGKDRYDGIVNTIKPAPELLIPEENVTYIRRTRVGELTLELGSPGMETTKLQIAAIATTKGASRSLSADYDRG